MNISKQVLIASAIVVSITGASAIAFAQHKDHDGHHQGDKKIQLLESSALDIRQAMDIALEDTPGKVIEVELEREDGQAVWEVELVNADNEFYEFEIDANSGEILEKEMDND